ncbi:MAG: UDP-N-acetylmuramoyl-tripeptide--D-alanyl-D-alanine ligase [Spirochaetia bacterium]|nr:UDP-N-acetylmuramoyl-tripeptide--D-alanyl-D-alanine ligase [Spirochaetia bacterium]
MIPLKDLSRLSATHFLSGIPASGRRIRGFSGVSTDTRTLKPGELFIALRGENFNGHDFLEQALSSQAGGALIDSKAYAVILAEKGEWHPDRPVLVVPDTAEALGELANLHRRKFNIPVLAIAGSNGKTTTKDLVASVLSVGHRVLNTEGNLNNHMGVPLTLLKLGPYHDLCVLELGTNHFGEIEKLCRISEPTHGLVTNIGKEHLEFFKDLKGVARAEFELYDFLLKKRGFLLGNVDDPWISGYFKKNAKKGAERMVSCSLKKTAVVQGKPAGYTNDFFPKLEIKAREVSSLASKNASEKMKKVSLKSSGKKRSFSVEVGIFGPVGSAAGILAASCGLLFGVEPVKIAATLKSFRPKSAKRMEVLRKKLGGGKNKKSREILVVLDAYNSNPDSVMMGLETIRDYGGPAFKGRKILVLGDMLELGDAAPSEHQKIGEAVRRLGFGHLFGFGPETRETVRKAGKLNWSKHYADQKALAGDLGKWLKDGDVVYIKGSRGMKMEGVLEALD